MTMTRVKEEEYAIAVREAGHAVIGFLCRRGVKSITIVKNEDEGDPGRCRYVIPQSNTLEFNDFSDISIKKFENLFRIDISGEVAEEIVLGKEWKLDGTDAEGCLQILDNLYFSDSSDEFIQRPDGISDDEWYAQIIEEKETSKREFTDRIVRETKEMMTTHINAIKAIADKLMQRKTISGRLARKIFKENLPKG